MTVLHIDLETRSAADLKKVGAHRYAEDPTTSIILASYRFDDGPVKRWCREDVPIEVIKHVFEGKPVAGHNQQFERAIWNAHVPPVQGAIYLHPEQQDCTMARAAAAGLPHSLDNLGRALNLVTRKDKDGHALMMRMCRPRTRDPLTWHESPDEIERLADYCDTDVIAEHEADRLLPPLSERERKVWILDQKINDRGFGVDLPLVQAAHQAVLEAQRRADDAMWRITGGAIAKATQTKKLAEWVAYRGVPCDSVADEEIDELLVAADMLDDKQVADALTLRRNSAGAFKFEAMLRAVCSDGRIRGTLQYHGTHGGRWAGRVVQPQNFKRVPEEAEHDIAATLDILRRYAGQPGKALDAMEMLLDISPLEALSMCARPMILAAPGHRLFDADFSNIEGRLNAWFAGAARKIAAFEARDRGEGHDLYKVTAGGILGKDPGDVTKTERQDWGKVPELACLGPDTLVVTNRGLVAITDVQLTDQLWDGEQWVNHEGCISRGTRRTIGLNGVEMTPDHAVLLGTTWCRAETVASDPAWIQFASVTGSTSLKSRALYSGLRAELGSYLFAAPVAQLNMGSTSLTCALADQLAAIIAQNARPDTGSKITSDMLTSCPTMHIDAGFLTEYRLASIDVTIPTTSVTETTAPAELKSTRLGEAINALFLRTSSAWKAGTIQALSLTGKTSTRAMNRAICDSYPAEKIKEIVERSRTYNGEYSNLRLVYDIAHAGPRNRFMIWGLDGPFIVHNCGYQGGRRAVQKQAAKIGVTLAGARAQQIVDGWRTSPLNEPIVESWYELQQAAIDACRAPGMIVPALRGRVKYLKPEDQDFLWCLLPSGRVISYAAPRVGWRTKYFDEDGQLVTATKLKAMDGEQRKGLEETQDFGVTFYGQKSGRWIKLDLYGGMQCAHIVSGTARDLLVEAMFATEAAGYPTILTIHDEVLTEARDGSAEHFKSLIVGSKPEWVDGLPLVADAWEDTRYVK